jgi:hypothetical protein
MKTKKCCNCNLVKELSEFNKNKTKRDGLNNICRICSNSRSKKYYSENVNHHKKVIRTRVNQIIQENRIKLFDFYKKNPCVDCGETDPIVLELDHKDGVEKLSEVSKLIGGGYRWETIECEIKKCDVRCANCHRRRTAKQFNWYKGII